MSDKVANKSRRSLLLLLVAFILPVVLAKLALDQHWFNYGVTNKGQLLENELTLNQLGIEQQNFKQHWLLVYRMPAQCDLLCQQTLKSINNTYVALGKEMPRVTPVLLSENNELPSELTNKAWQQLPLTPQIDNHLPQGQVLIVDPLGNFVLAHTPPNQAEQLAQFGKSILADFKKLLKYSKIG